MGLLNIPVINNDDEANEELFNSRFALIAAVLNGNIDAANLAAGAVTTNAIAANAVTSAKIEAQQAWQAVTYSNGWIDYDATYGGAQYYKDSLGIVHMRGLIKSGTATTGTTILTLPAGYRPSKVQLFEVSSNDARARLDVKTDGTVVTGVGINNTWVSLSNIHFRAEA